jgi:hypothetical protein
MGTATEFDADAAVFGLPREARSNKHQARLDQLKAEFILMALKKSPSDAERLEVGRCLEDNLPRDMLVDWVRATLKGEQLRANAIALELLNAAAEYHADLEV